MTATTTMKEFGGIIVPLMESTVDKDGHIPIKIIDAGWGSSGYYSKETLQKAVSEGVYHKGLQMYWNHPSASEEKDRPERNLRDLAAVQTSDAYWDENGKKGPGVYADAKVFSAYRDSVSEMGPHIGLSHYVWGESKTGEAEGRKGTIITHIAAARSVDFVTMPGRGGAIAEAFRTAGPPEPTSEQITANESTTMGDTAKPTITLESLKTERPDIVEAIRAEVEAGATTKEALAQTETKLKEAGNTITALKTENARMSEALTLIEAKGFVESKVKDAKIPDITKARIVESLARVPPMKDGKLDTVTYTASIEAAIKSEAEYLAKIAGSGSVRDLGTTTPATPTAAESDAALIQAFVSVGMTKEAAEAAIRRA